MSTLKSLIIIILTATVLACNSSEKEQTKTIESEQLSAAEIDQMTAQEIVTTVCENCHHPTANPDNRLAPPLEIAKRNYLALYPDKESFVEAMTSFVVTPTAEQAELHSDVDNFGVMDPLGYSEEQVREVSAYIYDTDLQKPDWLE